MPSRVTRYFNKLYKSFFKSHALKIQCPLIKTSNSIIEESADLILKEEVKECIPILTDEIKKRGSIFMTIPSIQPPPLIIEKGKIVPLSPDPNQSLYNIVHSLLTRVNNLEQKIEQQGEIIQEQRKVMQFVALDKLYKIGQERVTFFAEYESSSNKKALLEFYNVFSNYLSQYFKIFDICNSNLVKPINMEQFTQGNLVKDTRSFTDIFRIITSFIPIIGDSMDIILDLLRSQYEELAYCTISKKISYVLDNYIEKEGIVDHNIAIKSFQEKTALKIAAPNIKQMEEIFANMTSNVPNYVKLPYNIKKQFKANDIKTSNMEYWAKKIVKNTIKDLYTLYETGKSPDSTFDYFDYIVKSAEKKISYITKSSVNDSSIATTSQYSKHSIDWYDTFTMIHDSFNFGFGALTGELSVGELYIS